MKILFKLISVLFFGTLFGQGELLVTIEKNDAIRSLKSNFENVAIELAFPKSRKPLFKKVYRISYENANVVAYINRNKQAFLNPVEVEDITPLYEPNDYNLAFSSDYALDIINAQEAWTITKGDSSVTIGISDTNYDLDHEELVNKVSKVSPNLFHSDVNHGTAVAIAAAGETDNNLGKASIGYNSDLVLYNTNFNDLLEMSYDGVQIINMSWSNGCTFNPYYQELIDELYENGTILVAAAGNGNTCNKPATAYVYPAAYDKVISVSSIGPNDNHERVIGNPSSTHQHNDKVDLVAPGYDVALSISGNSYLTGNGTSFAAPMVSGTIALMLSENPCLTYEEVLAILKSTAVNIDHLNPNYAGLLGAGRIDAQAAVQTAKELANFDYSSDSYFDCESNDFVLEIFPIDTASVDSVTWADGGNGWKRFGLAQGDYEFTIHKSNGCSFETEVNYIPEQNVFDYNSSVLITNNSMTLQDFDGDGVITVRGNIIIEEGVDANIINREIAFGQKSPTDSSSSVIESGIVVKKNASLSIVNSKLTNLENCTDSWDGIRLIEHGENDDINLGLPNLFIDNSTISNAKIGVSNSVYEASNSQYRRVRILNSNFKDNTIGVSLKEGATENYPQTIRNNEFKTNYEDVKHLQISDVNSLLLTNNLFEGFEATADSLRGKGVVLFNSNLNTSAGDKINNELESANIYKNLFQGLYSANNSSSRISTLSNHDEFDNCSKAATILGKQNLIVENNTFNTTTEEVQDNFGLWIENPSYLNVFNNTFIGNNSKAQGLVIFDFVDTENEIYGNFFEGSFTSGVHVEYAEDNIELNCNKFSLDSGIRDIGAHSSSISIQTAYREAVTNSFSDCENLSYNISVDKQSASLEYLGNSYFEPNCISSQVEYTEISGEDDWSLACPSKVAQFNIPTDDDIVVNEYKEDHETSASNVLSTSDYSNHEIKEHNQELVYPNPNNGSFAFKTNSEIQSFIIYDMQGRIIGQEDYSVNGENVTIHNANPGAYQVKIVGTDNLVSVVKFIVI